MLDDCQPRRRTLLYIDMAYSLAELTIRRHFQFFEARHSRGYFSRVIALHPLADRVTQLDSAIERRRFSDKQDVIEAKSAALGLPRWLFAVDFMISQRRLLDRMTDLVRDEGITMITATDPLYAGLFGLWLRRRTGVPLVIHLIANYDLNYETSRSLAMPRLVPCRALEKWLIRYVMRRADLIAAGSETLRGYALKHGVARERSEIFRVAKNIVPEHRVPPRQRKPLSAVERHQHGIKDGKLLLTVARLEPLKLVDSSIRAFSIVVKAHPDAQLLLAGEGSERGRLEALSNELGLADRVRFLGMVDQEFLSRLEPECVTLSPLTGMALFETSMAGSPAVAYNIDSAVEDMVETGVTGTLLDRGDWEGMGRAASRLLDDPSEFARQSAAIRERAERLTDEEQLYAHEHAAFDRLLGPPP